MGIQSSTDKVEGIENSSSTPSSTSNIQIEHLETFNLIWLGEKRFDDQNQLLKKRLRQLSTNFIYFDEVKSCEQWLNSRPNHEKILFIVSGRVGPKIVPHVHNLTSIIGIYVFSMILENTSAWIQPYSKIRTTIFTSEELIQQILKDQRYFENIEDSKTIQIFKARPHTRILDPQYSSIIWYQLFIEILLSPSYLPSSPSPKQFIDILRQSISNDEESLNLIKEFESTYDKQNPMKWLTNNTSIARFLHKALREQNIEILFYLRFFLVDISNQLMSNQLFLIRVYRKQLMSRENVENLRSNVNNHLMMNGFLSTSIKPFDTSIIDKNENGYENVFIEIDAEKQNGTLPFAYVPNSMNNGENDPGVLFMCGSIFKIISCESNINSNCRLKLSLVGSKELNILNDKRLKLRETNDLLMVVELLDQSNQSDKANIYCEGLLREFPSNHHLIPSINDKLNMNVKVESVTLAHSKFVIIGLTEDNLSPLAFQMLNALKSLLTDSISIGKNVSEVNFDAISDKHIFIFTDYHLCPFVINKTKAGFVYVLEEKSNTSVQEQHYNDSEDLINELADELYRCYISEIEDDRKSGETNLLKKKEEKANEIPKKIKELNQTPIQTLIYPDTKIIWLGFHDEDNGRIKRIKRLLEEKDLSFLSFGDREYCHNYTCGEGFNHSLYLIIDDRYDDSSITTLFTLKNIKKIYRYNTSLPVDCGDNVFSRLICDLITYYNDLGDECQQNHDSEQAQRMFQKAANLCKLYFETIQ